MVDRNVMDIDTAICC